jgi:hypothetical protein
VTGGRRNRRVRQRDCPTFERSGSDIEVTAIGVEQSDRSPMTMPGADLLFFSHGYHGAVLRRRASRGKRARRVRRISSAPANDRRGTTASGRPPKLLRLCDRTRAGQTQRRSRPAAGSAREVDLTATAGRPPVRKSPANRAFPARRYSCSECPDTALLRNRCPIQEVPGNRSFRRGIIGHPRSADFAVDSRGLGTNIGSVPNRLPPGGDQPNALPCSPLDAPLPRHCVRPTSCPTRP